MKDVKKEILNWYCKFLDLWFAVLGRNHLCGCGHDARLKTLIKREDVEGLYTLDRDRECCPECFISASARCAWCGCLVVPGSPVAIYAWQEERGEPPPHAVFYDNSRNDKTTQRYVLVCLRSGCGWPEDRQGFWVLPGRIERVLSPLEECLYQDDLVICNDLSDPRRAIRVKE